MTVSRDCLRLNIIRKDIVPYQSEQKFRAVIGGWLVKMPVTLVARASNIVGLGQLPDLFLNRLVVHSWEDVLLRPDIEATTPVVIAEFPPVGDQDVWYDKLGEMRVPVFAYSHWLQGNIVEDVEPVKDIEMRFYDRLWRGEQPTVDEEGLLDRLEERGLIEKKSDRWVLRRFPEYEWLT